MNYRKIILYAEDPTNRKTTSENRHSERRRTKRVLIYNYLNKSYS